MEIIREIEDGPRGVYTGAIGLVKPGGDARFSVAIRTLTVDRQNHELSYGVGGGIVWDSGVEEEWQECRDKARVLKFKRPSFSLLETMRYEPGQGVCLAHRHRQRMQSSAAYFGIHFSEEAWQACVESVTGNETLRLRLLLSPDGDMQLEQFSFADDESEVILGIAREPVSSEDIFLFHKTTHRDVYERAKEGAGDCDDVVRYNELDEITETTIANLFLEFNGELLTPARESGLLAGTYRQEMLDEGRARESLLSIDDLHAADRIYVANTLRGIRPARLI
jgi:para-aminobenzoate synthetase/4-amino-4-deoxychorismate lyase